MRAGVDVCMMCGGMRSSRHKEYSHYLLKAPSAGYACHLPPFFPFLFFHLKGLRAGRGGRGGVGGRCRGGDGPSLA